MTDAILLLLAAVCFAINAWQAKSIVSLGLALMALGLGASRFFN